MKVGSESEVTKLNSSLGSHPHFRDLRYGPWKSTTALPGASCKSMIKSQSRLFKHSAVFNFTHETCHTAVLCRARSRRKAKWEIHRVRFDRRPPKPEPELRPKRAPLNRRTAEPSFIPLRPSASSSKSFRCRCRRFPPQCSTHHRPLHPIPMANHRLPPPAPLAPLAPPLAPPARSLRAAPLR